MFFFFILLNVITLSHYSIFDRKTIYLNSFIPVIISSNICKEVGYWEFIELNGITWPVCCKNV